MTVTKIEFSLDNNTQYPTILHVPLDKLKPSAFTSQVYNILQREQIPHFIFHTTSLSHVPQVYRVLSNILFFPFLTVVIPSNVKQEEEKINPWHNLLPIEYVTLSSSIQITKQQLAKHLFTRTLLHHLVFSSSSGSPTDFYETVDDNNKLMVDLEKSGITDLGKFVNLFYQYNIEYLQRIPWSQIEFLGMEIKEIKTAVLDKLSVDFLEFLFDFKVQQKKRPIETYQQYRKKYIDPAIEKGKEDKGHREVIKQNKTQCFRVEMNEYGFEDRYQEKEDNSILKQNPYACIVKANTPVKISDDMILNTVDMQMKEYWTRTSIQKIKHVRRLTISDNKQRISDLVNIIQNEANKSPLTNNTPSVIFPFHQMGRVLPLIQIQILYNKAASSSSSSSSPSTEGKATIKHTQQQQKPPVLPIDIRRLALKFAHAYRTMVHPNTLKRGPTFQLRMQENTVQAAQALQPSAISWMKQNGFAFQT